MGKHVRKLDDRSKLRGLLKGCLVFLVLFLVAGGVGAYAYIKYIEGRLHGNGKSFREAQKVISEPPPDEPINFLLLGSDTRNGEQARADTMIIAHVDLKEKKAILLSIPRDTRVKIPGKKGHDKINAAYALGGVPLAIRTVEEFTNLPIHHYAATDFKGFKKMVDALGGVEIDVTHPINCKQRRYKMYVPAGPQTFDGKTALNYARFRHDAKGDFGRIERQQEFIGALVKKIMRLESVLKLPKLVSIFTDNTSTDLDASEILRFATFARSIDRKNIEMLSVPGKPKSMNGVSYVIADEDELEKIITALKEGRSVAKEETKQRKANNIPNSSIRVKVLNGCGIAGVASSAETKLGKLGFVVAATGNANNFNYRRTLILYREDSHKKALKASNYFENCDLQQSTTSLGEGVDIVVIVGKDYADK